jgi:hypothetical protein
MNLYAYCLSDEATPAMIESVTGVDTTAPRLIRCGRLWAVASEFAGTRIAQTRENVEAHNRVNSHLLAHTTPLPFRFGTLATRQQLESYIGTHESQLVATLGRVRGAVEMSMKVMWDVEAERSDAEAVVAEEASRGRAAAGPVSGDGGRASAGSGTEFLAAKRRALAGEAALKERAEEVCAWIAANLGDTIKEERVTVNASQALVVRAAHLVERARLEEYRERLRSLREERRSSLRFLTSGAWPPYSFTEI